MFGAANELDAGEEGDAAGQQHGEGAQRQASLAAGVGGRRVPAVEGPALGLVVDVVEQAVLRHQQRVALEGALCKYTNYRYTSQ